MSDAVGKAILLHAARISAIELCVFALAKTSPNPDELIAEIDRLKDAVLRASNAPEDFVNQVSSTMEAAKNYADLGKGLKGGQ